MTVANLIILLEQFAPDMEVVHSDSCDDDWNLFIPVGEVKLSEAVRKSTEPCGIILQPPARKDTLLYENEKPLLVTVVVIG